MKRNQAGQGPGFYFFSTCKTASQNQNDIGDVNEKQQLSRYETDNFYYECPLMHLYKSFS
jgi:hypothetical protein